MRFVVVMLVAACSFTHGSAPAADDLNGSGTDAMIPGDGQPDAMTDGAIDAPASITCAQSTCTAAGGACIGGVCEIDQNGPGGVACPAGVPCRVICFGASDCQAGLIQCGNATTCDVRCEGSSACQDQGVDCGTAAVCTVRCFGANACQHGTNGRQSVECHTSMCTVTCDGSNACQDGIDVDPGGTCTSHCCDNACEGGFDTCINDSACP
jgi:hypothetical protein